MLSESEKGVLEVFGERLLIRKDELKSVLSQKGLSDGIVTVNKLSGMGYVKFIENVGAPCYTITQDGIKILRK